MRARWIVLLLAVALLASGCSKKKSDSEDLVGFVDKTTPHAYRLKYEVTEGKVDVAVQGIIEDDFRYKLQMAVDDETAAEQVVVDDAVALRFLDSKLIDAYLDPAVKGQVKTDTDVPGATVFDALTAGRWVLDPAGAPSPILTSLDQGDKVDTPKDPLFDARTALSYVRRVAQSTPFIKYDSESINPIYRKDEDPFPVPGEGSGVDRYDSLILDLPSAAAATGADRALPSALNFRKMAVYVKKGVIIAAREFIGATPRQLKDLQSYEEALLTATANDAVLAGFRAKVSSLAGDGDALSEFLVGGLNTFITSTGSPPIRFRTMALEITDLDAVTSDVSLPTDAVKADLAVIRNLGRKPDTTGSEADASTPSTTTTTTTTTPSG